MNTLEVFLSSPTELLNVQLIQTQKCTSANWVALIGQTDNGWEIIADSKISRSKVKGLELFISDNLAWLASSLDSKRVRYKTLKKAKAVLLSAKIYCFAVPEVSKIIIIGADDLSKEDRSVFKLNAKILASQISIFIENVSLYKELEEKNEAQQIVEDRLVQSAKLAAVGEMAAGVAHELNNPLTTVSGFAELILDSMPKESPDYEDMTLILKEARRARSVVRRLLDFSRQDEILRLDTDINEMVSTVLALVHHLAQLNDVKISVALWNDIPMVRLERNQIQQVFLNLIHNAIQAMPNGGDLVIETQVNSKEDENWIIVTIKDNGIGIGKKDLDKIFKPFFTTKISGEGTGLGLSISYRIVVDHGGYIDVDSKPGVGTTFAVWLPIENPSKKELE